MIKRLLNTFKVQFFSFAIILALSFIVKDFIVTTYLPQYYTTFEIISLVLVLCFVYYVDTLITNRNQLIDQLSQEVYEIKNQYTKRESHLLSKIMKLEEREREEQLLSIHKKKTIQRFANHIRTESYLDVTKSILPALSTIFEIVAGIFYWHNDSSNVYESQSFYGLEQDGKTVTFIKGEGFCGQAVADQSIIVIDEMKMKDDEWLIETGLGHHRPRFIYFIPILDDNNVYGLIEIATFKQADIDKIWNELSIKIIELVNSNKVS